MGKGKAVAAYPALLGTMPWELLSCTGENALDGTRGNSPSVPEYAWHCTAHTSLLFYRVKTAVTGLSSQIIWLGPDLYKFSNKTNIPISKLNVLLEF